MLNTIAVMNTKGGVGKSTLVLALAETMSAFHGRNVLVIDSDAQASVSSMLMSVPDLYKLQTDGRTIVDYLVSTVLNGAPTDWTQFIVPKVSDVDDARGVYLLPSDMQLTLLEREVSKESQHTRLRASIGRLLADAGNVFDVVLIDCPPGLSVLTECWLREADFHISPTKPDYVSICGLEVFRRFKALNPEMGFARNLGVIVNLEDTSSASDAEYVAWLASAPDNRCYPQSVPRVKALQDAARYQTQDRSFAAKYPGVVGQALKTLTAQVLERLQVDQTAAALAAASDDARRAAEQAAAPAAAPQGPDAAPEQQASARPQRNEAPTSPGQDALPPMPAPAVTDAFAPAASQTTPSMPAAAATRQAQPAPADPTPVDAMASTPAAPAVAGGQPAPSRSASDAVSAAIAAMTPVAAAPSAAPAVSAPPAMTPPAVPQATASPAAPLTPPPLPSMQPPSPPESAASAATASRPVAPPPLPQSVAPQPAPETKPSAA